MLAKGLLATRSPPASFLAGAAAPVVPPPRFSVRSPRLSCTGGDVKPCSSLIWLPYAILLMCLMMPDHAI